MRAAEAMLLRVSLPSRVDRLADQGRRIGAGARTEFLEASGVDLGDVEVPFLIGAHAVHAPERAREIADGPPRIEETPVEVELQHLMGQAIEARHRPIRADLHEVEARGPHGNSPLGEVPAVLVEDLDAVVVAIVDEYPPC